MCHPQQVVSSQYLLQADLDAQIREKRNRIARERAREREFDVCVV